MRPIRMFEDEKLYFITNRTVHGRLLLRPSPEVNRLIGGIMARGLSLFPVKLYGFVFASNHFHLVLAGNAKAISNFMGHLQSNISVKLGKLHGWSGGLFPRRYSSAPILDNSAVEDRIQYIFEHGVKEGLVGRAEKWPGLTSIPELTSGQLRTFQWPDRSKNTADKEHRQLSVRKKPGKPLPLTVLPLPHWMKLPRAKQRNLARNLLKAANVAAREKRSNKKALGVNKVLAQSPSSIPRSSKRTTRPQCHTTCAFLRREFQRQYREFCIAFRDASQRFMAGQLEVRFPQGSFRPPSFVT